MVSFPHFLKVSFKLIKCSLSYSLQCDPRPFSEFTQVWTISSLTASKMHFGGHHWLSGNSMLIERWNCPQMNVQSINGSLRNAFLEAVNDKMVQTCVNSENGLKSHFTLHLRPHFKNLNEIFENVGMMPINILYLMKFLFAWTSYAQMAHFRCLKTFR